MKKLIALLLVALMVFCLVACGGDSKTDDGKTNEGENTAEEIKGEVYDTGAFKALVPEGWKAFPVSDMFSEEENATDPEKLQIVKGGETEWDLFSKPYVGIYLYPDSSLMTPSKDWYDKPADLEPMTIGGYTWNGFTGESAGYPQATLWTSDANGNDIQVTIILKSSDGEITLEDADVLAILESIKAN